LATGSGPTRRFTDSVEPTATVIGAGTTVRGDIVAGDPLEIRGTVEGDCRVDAPCIVREGARVVGNVEAASLLVAGEVEAGTLSAEKVEIRASARVRGAIKARTVAIADGAHYEGSVQMHDPASGPVLFQERRAARPGEK
jgi:cytoskeletal protein CcmA (bactofilin family)